MDMHNIFQEFDFQPDGTTDYGVSCRLERLKMEVLIFFMLTSYKDMHKILDEFEFPPDPTTYCGVTALSV